MKKRICILCMMAVFATALFCGCGNNAGEENNSQNKGQVSQSEKENTQTTEKNTEQIMTESTENSETKETESSIEDFSMFFTGDILLKNAVVADYETEGLNSIISEYLESEMNEADLTMVNEEFPFSTRGTQAPDKQFTFRINPSYVSVFQDMGVDVVSLANNHE